MKKKIKLELNKEFKNERKTYQERFEFLLRLIKIGRMIRNARIVNLPK